MMVIRINKDNIVTVGNKIVRRYTEQELKEAYDKGFTQGYNEGCRETREEAKYEAEDEGWN